MNIEINHSRIEYTHQFEGKRDIEENTDYNAFAWLEEELKKNNFEITTDTERKVESHFNLDGGSKRYFGGGAEILTIIQTIGIYAASLGGFIELVNALIPIFRKYFKKSKKSVDKIVLTYGDYKFEVHNTKDLKKLLKFVNELDKKNKGKKN